MTAYGPLGLDGYLCASRPCEGLNRIRYRMPEADSAAATIKSGSYLRCLNGNLDSYLRSEGRSSRRTMQRHPAISVAPHAIAAPSAGLCRSSCSSCKWTLQRAEGVAERGLAPVRTARVYNKKSLLKRSMQLHVQDQRTLRPSRLSASGDFASRVTCLTPSNLVGNRLTGRRKRCSWRS